MAITITTSVSEIPFSRITQTVTTVTVAAGAATVDWSVGNKFKVILGNSGNTITLTNVPDASTAERAEIALVQPASGSAGTVTWAGPTFDWGTSGAPTLTTTNGAVDRVVFGNADASHVWGAVVGLGFSV